MAELRNMNTYDDVRRRKEAVGGIVHMTILCGLGLAAVAAIYMAVAVWMQLHAAPSIASLRNYAGRDSIQILDRQDKLIYSIKSDQNRRRVSLEQIAPVMRSAALAAEDHNFYQHSGINFMSIGRSMLSNLRAGRVVEGGSTITQQLVKNVFFDQPKRNLERKVAEALIASQLEQELTKDQILELYLNEAYFGNGAYGIEQAARFYFGKPASRLSTAESAFLAGLIKSPSRLGDRANRSAAMEQQRDTIEKMARFGFVSEMRAKFALSERLRFYERDEEFQPQKLEKYPYLISYVLDLVKQKCSTRDLNNGLKIYTSIDMPMQNIAEKSMRDGVDGAPAGVTEGALATVSVRDGSVLALVGGVGDYEKHQYNCATHPHTVGSAFKPFVYIAALEGQVVTPESFIDDAPLVVKDGNMEWRPQNYDRRFVGEITARDALVFSRNIPAVKLAQQIGINAVIDAAHRAGIRQVLDANLSLALGSSAISPLEMAGAYATFARGGLSIRPWLLRRIENGRGRILDAFQQPMAQAFTPDAVNQLVSILHEVVTRGTGQEANLKDAFVAGKTGTADQAKDLWFVGFTPELATAVWVGNDENEPIKGSHVTGGTVVAKIWKRYMVALFENPELIRAGLVVKQPQAATVARAPAIRRPAARRPTVSTVSAEQPAAAARPALPPKQGLLQPMQPKMDTTQSQTPNVRLQF